MLILGLGLSVLLKIILFNSLIFLFNSLGKFSLILSIFLIFLDEIWVYKGLPDSATFLTLPWVFLPWNLDFSRTSFDGLEESWGKGSLEKLASLVGEEGLVFFPLLGEETLVVNSSLISFWKDTAEMKLKAI